MPSLPAACSAPFVRETRGRTSSNKHDGCELKLVWREAREFFFDHFTAAEAHFFWCIRRGTQLGVDVSGFPNCSAHFDRIKARSSVRVGVGEIGERGILQGGIGGAEAITRR